MSEDRTTSLYRRYGPVIYWRCIRILGERSAAEDATQETFVRVYRHLAKAPDGDEAIAWIMRIATNYCLNQLRDVKRRTAALETFADHLAQHSARDLFGDRDLASRIIQRADPRVRTVAWLHYVDGLEQVEVARILGISRRTVANRLHTFVGDARKFAARAAS